MWDVGCDFFGLISGLNLGKAQGEKRMKVTNTKTSGFVLRGLSALAMGLAGLVAVSCGPESGSDANRSGTDSVEIPQTPVENQNRVGFCWAYAAVGLVESDFKVRTGEELQLSEEALGFHRMVEGIYFLTQNLQGQDLIDMLNQDTFQGWVLKSDEVPDTFALVERYGVMPESVWSLKFTDENKVDAMVKAIRRAAAKIIVDTPNPRSITREQIAQDILLAPGAWSSAPPTEFEVDGVRYTPKTYLKHLGFRPQDYTSVATNRPQDLDRLIRAAKRSLVRGVSVPLGFPVNFDRLELDRFTGKNADLSRGEDFFRDGGHAVLIEDFVNLGGREGALPLADVLQEFLRPPTELDYFVFKNSWGTDAKMNEAGVVLRGSKTGYYKIDRLYLEGSANLSRDPQLAGFLEVIVPVDIAADPSGHEDVNPKVALP
jgi:hypothetical protein